MENFNVTPEMLAKAKAAASADELLTLAKAAGLDLTAQEAQTYFKVLHGEKCEGLNEADLDKVAGRMWAPGSNAPPPFDDC